MNKTPSFCALILAAGLSSRMGGNPKALAMFTGKSFLEHSATLFRRAGVSDIFVVTGHQHGQVEREASRLNLKVIYNPDYHNGMFASCRKGFTHLAELQKKENSSYNAGFLLPVDIFLVRAESVCRLIQAWKRLDNPETSIIIPQHAGKNGHPPLIGQEHFLNISSLALDTHLEQYFLSLSSCADATQEKAEGKCFPPKHGPIFFLSVPDVNILHDIDTLQELECLHTQHASGEQSLHGIKG